MRGPGKRAGSIPESRPGPALTQQGAVARPACGTETSRVHEWERTVEDVPADVRRVMAKVRVRRSTPGVRAHTQSSNPARLRIRPASTIEPMLPEDERRQYAARQYESLREEIAQARDAQHSILQWNQAVAGTLFAAALVAGTSHLAHSVIAAQFIFGLVLPAVLLGGALAWSGEMIRMERAGVFLRFFERTTWASDGDDGIANTSLFMWENFLWSPPATFVAAGYRKQNVGYVGVAVYFSVMYLGSLIAFCTISLLWLSLATCVALVILGLSVTAPPAIQLFTLGGSALSLSDNDLTKWIKQLEESKGLLAQSGSLTRIGKSARHLVIIIRRRRDASHDDIL